MNLKALYKSSPVAGLELVDRPMPQHGPAEVLIRVLRTGTCGTDLHIERWDDWASASVDAPLVVGHEFFGEVVEVGASVRDVRVGDRVSGEGHIVCRTCRNCRAGRLHLCARTSSLGVNRDGAFAEYVALPESNVWVQSSELDADLGAIFDPFGNAVHTALSYPVVGEDVLITGAGPIGLMAAAVCRHAGARRVVVTDVAQYRLRLAERMGADVVVDVTNESLADVQTRIGMAEGFDVALEMSGHPEALPQILRNMSHGGRVALLGLPSSNIAVDWSSVVNGMITIAGVYGRRMFDTWYAMTALIRSGLDIAPVITHRFTASDWAAGFSVAASADCGKVVLDWTTV